MSKVVSVDQMRAIERAADASGWTYDDMMRRAGEAVAAEVVRVLGDPAGRQALILVGPGNNGGDGLVSGARLLETGMQVTAWLTRPRSQPDPHTDGLRRLGGAVVSAQDDAGMAQLVERAAAADVVIDAILGTGTSLPLREGVGKILAGVGEVLGGRRPRPLVVAVDCPSGLECDTGAIAPEAIAADLTVTLAAAKPGLLRFPGAGRCGRIVVADIGLRPDMKELSEVKIEFVTQADVRGWIPARPADAHKGTFGTVLVVGGSANYPGSVGLAGEAAYRVGAGLVSLAVPGSIHGFLVSFLPEATWLVLPHETGVIAEAAAEIVRGEAERADALVIGPGLGREATTRRFLSRILVASESGARGNLGFIHGGRVPAETEHGLPPIVVDADALRLLGEVEGWARRLPPGSVLTPHPGELSALTGLSVETIQSNREGVARERAMEWGHVVLLKGAHTVIAAPDGRAWVLPFATAALAKAGTGDVLAGAIGGLCAQGVGPLEAAVLGAYLHGLAGTLAAEQAGSTAGVLAAEVARALPQAIRQVSSA